MAASLARFSPYALGLLRIVAALLFVEHGTMKLMGFPVSATPLPPIGSLPGIAGLFELVGGLMILVGFFTRAAAFVCSGVMAFAYFLAHAPQSFFPVLNGGDAAILYCFIFLYLVFAGGGAWTLDGRRKGS